MVSIGTHSGKFHADEACAVFMLKQLPDYENAEVIRTRDNDVLDKCTIVVDVGGVYDAEKLRFDHHQRGFAETMAELDEKFAGTKLSSAGLIYRHYGRRVIDSILAKHSLSCPAAFTETLFTHVYNTFMHAIDANDTGRAIAEDPAYRITTDLPSRVARLNPAWNQSQTDEEALAMFHQAVNMVGEELTDAIVRWVRHSLPARKVVSDAYASRKQHHASGQVVVLDSFCPWPAHLKEVEEEGEAPVLYVVFPSSDSYRIQAVPGEKEFSQRKPLPEPWRGVRDAALDEASGIEGCVFVHAAGFIGGNKTLEGALKMAAAAVIA
ncbi:metal-dependent protein hydrolase [Carpediemonas membranifera]|uniref:Metal-dependent protein hydrolase n=1 Tax=Carpediemonas membranifera TaxID=201153 RepID=A0A8J6AYG0_9EUKA|nr:metal-dependent protein hydrolase [Carpediemonas membranifera]|eukprot:KAG9391503.1 metal-dependent protein hydrolase [Carpediemonas membranifera]